MSESYPFVDLRPSLRFSQTVWDAMAEWERQGVLREAVFSHVRIEVVADGEEPPAPR